LRFSLWSSATDPASGGQLATTIARNAVPVTIGLFTTSFYFGFGLIDNKQLFLQTEVRSPSCGGPFKTLISRQPLTAALTAQFARNADNAANLRGSPAAAFLPRGASSWAQPDVGTRAIVPILVTTLYSTTLSFSPGNVIVT